MTVIMLSVMMLIVTNQAHYADCSNADYAECHDADCYKVKPTVLMVVMLTSQSSLMLSVANNVLYADCSYAE
jgi:hypothetical protein